MTNTENLSTNPFERPRQIRERRYAAPKADCNVCHGHGIGGPGWDRYSACPGCHGTQAGAEMAEGRR